MRRNSVNGIAQVEFKIDVNEPTFKILNTTYVFRHLSYNPEEESYGYANDKGQLIAIYQKLDPENTNDPDHELLTEELHHARSLVLFAYLMEAKIICDAERVSLDGILTLFEEHFLDIFANMHKMDILIMNDYMIQGIFVEELDV